MPDAPDTPPPDTPTAPDAPAAPTGLPGIGSLTNAGLGTVQTAVGFSLGVAAAGALEPVGTGIRQTAFTLDPNKAADVFVIAQGVAQGQVDDGQAKAWAYAQGYNDDAFAALVDTAKSGMELGNAFQSWRRGDLTDGEFDTQLHRLGIESEWWPKIRALKEERLDLGALATAIHRGIIDGTGLLLQEPPTTPGEIPQVPPSNIDPLAEAAAHGIGKERLRVLVGNTGLPLSLGEMLALLNRGKVTVDDVKRSVAESNLRNEYMDAAVELRRQLPTARDYLENALRGYRSLPDALEGAALHGMTHDDATMIYQNQGRPMALHQITQALARGGKFKPEEGEITDPYRASIVEGNLKPAYYDLAFANRYNYPSPFVLRSLAQTGVLSHADTLQTLLNIGWEPGFAKKVADEWAGGSTAAADTHVSKAQTQLWTAAHKSYLNGLTTDPDATADLTAAGVTVEAIPAVIALWKQEREIVRRSLTATQIKKAIGQPGLDTAWATARLRQLGYSTEDATTFLAE